MTSGLLDPQFLIDEIEDLGETLTLSTIYYGSATTWGDISETTSDTSIKAVINVVNTEEELVREGKFQPGDLRVFFKPGQSVEIGDKIYRTADSKWYQVVELNDYFPTDTEQAIEARAQKI